MLAIAAFALLLVGLNQAARWKAISEVRHSLAWIHAIDAQTAEKMLPQAKDAAQKQWLTSLSRHHRVLEQKWRRLANRPWTSPPRDPPPPAYPFDSI